MDNALIGKMIRKYRKEQGYTQQQFAEVASLSPNYLGSIERGIQPPKLETLVNIANILNVTTDELLMGVVSKARDLQVSLISRQMQGLQDEQITMVLNVVEQMTKDFKRLNKALESDKN